MARTDLFRFRLLRFMLRVNALLRERGHRSVGAGHAIAVQNLAENGAMLVMIGLYTLAARAGFAVAHIAAVFGVALSAAIALLWVYRVRSRSHRHEY